MSDHGGSLTEKVGDAPPVYRITNLTKRYVGQSRAANEDITFDVNAGEIFGILGENGAGKSTLVRQMIHLLAPTAGSIEFLGRPLGPNASRQVGYLPQQADALNHLTVEEALYYTAHLRSLSATAAVEDRDTLIRCWHLDAIRSQDSATLSGGQRRLLRIAVAAAGRPDVLILDEPTSDLDPTRRRMVWRNLRRLRQTYGVTIILVTHDAAEAERVVDRVAIVRQGRMVAIGAPSRLKDVVGRVLQIEWCYPASEPPRLPDGVVPEQRGRGCWTVRLPWRDMLELLQQLDPAKVEDLRVTMPTLEDVLIHYAQSPPRASVQRPVP